MKRIFIVGPTRAGTSLTQRICSSGSRLVSLPESHLFRLCLRRRAQHFETRPENYELACSNFSSALAEASLPHEPVDQLLRQLQSSHHSAQAVSKQIMAALDEVARRAELDGFIEKTPAHIFRLPAIRAGALENCVIVHVTRSCAPTVRSRVLASTQWGKPSGYAPSLLHWMVATLVTIARKQYADEILVRYEELVGRSEATLGLLADKIGHPLDYDHLPTASTGASVAPKNEPWRSRAALPIEQTLPTGMAGGASRHALDAIGATLDRGLQTALQASDSGIFARSCGYIESQTLHAELE